MIDFDKPVKTRDGREVRILCTNAPKAFPVVGYIINDYHDVVQPALWTLEGMCLEGKRGLNNLVNVKTKREGWVNIYKQHCGGNDSKDRTCGDIHKEYDRAAYMAAIRSDYITTVKIEWEE